MLSPSLTCVFTVTFQNQRPGLPHWATPRRRGSRGLCHDRVRVLCCRVLWKNGAVEKWTTCNDWEPTLWIELICLATLFQCSRSLRVLRWKINVSLNPSWVWIIMVKINWEVIMIALRFAGEPCCKMRDPSSCNVWSTGTMVPCMHASHPEKSWETPVAW